MGAQIDGVRDEKLVIKINFELLLPREEQEAWDELFEGDVETLEITEISEE